MGGNVRNLVKQVLGAPLLGAGLTAVAAMLAGCSSDVSRFNAPVFGLTQAKPTPAEPVYDGAAPAHAETYAPIAAPPPDYANNNFGDNGRPAPNYVYRGPAPSAPYASNATVNGAPNSFGTVPGQPESYHPERLASNGRTPYIVEPGQQPAARLASGFAPAPINGSPEILPPAAPGAGQIGVLPHRGKPGSLVEVLPGETLYMFSRRNGVSISAVMAANNMHSPNVQPGMKLIIPGRGGRSILPPTASLAPLAPVAPAPQVGPTLAAAAAATPVATSGTYTVQAGESVYSIARKHNVKPQDIMAANTITDITKVKFGQVLKMPVGAGLVAANPAKTAGTRLAALQPAPSNTGPVMTDADKDGIPDGMTTDADAPAAANNDLAPVAAPSKLPVMSAALTPVKPKATGPVDPASAPIGGRPNLPAKHAAVTPAAPAATPAAADPATDVPSDGRFRWPVHGRVIAQFGQDAAGGARNEGIDLAVPLGTEVHAAENGVVSYVGDELKGFGKLVIVRHADNWVTAYAHNDELLVKRGDNIRRGQVIAKAGKSGGIDQPLLHFELRKGSAPVDPLPHMASN